MRITIVTVCYNAAEHIERCLSSVAEQTYPEIEHIIVDGASTDETLAIVRRFPHVAQLISEPDEGIYSAMNKGIERATGDYLLFLNADDGLPQPSSLADAVQEMGRNPGGDVYYGSLEVHPANGGDPVVFRPPPPSEAPMLMVCGCLPHQATFARPSVFSRTGHFDEQYAYHADYDWFLKILANPEIDVRAISTIVAVFREGGASSNLAKGQPEVYAIQNESPLYAGEDWDKLRIAEFQKMFLRERIENQRLREEIRAFWQMANGCSAVPLPKPKETKVAQPSPSQSAQVWFDSLRKLERTLRGLRPWKR